MENKTNPYIHTKVKGASLVFAVGFLYFVFVHPQCSCSTTNEERAHFAAQTEHRCQNINTVYSVGGTQCQLFRLKVCDKIRWYLCTRFCARCKRECKELRPKLKDSPKDD